MKNKGLWKLFIGISVGMLLQLVLYAWFHNTREEKKLQWPSIACNIMVEVPGEEDRATFVYHTQVIPINNGGGFSWEPVGYSRIYHITCDYGEFLDSELELIKSSGVYPKELPVLRFKENVRGETK